MLEVTRPPPSPPSDSADHDILTIPDVWNPWKVKVKVIVLPFETRGWLETVLSVARQMSAKEGDSSGFLHGNIWKSEASQDFA